MKIYKTHVVSQSGCGRVAEDLPLFSKVNALPHSASKDPITSFAAGERMIKSGAKQTHAKQVFEALSRHGGLTAAELAEVIGMDRYEVQRRLADLKNTGLAEHGPERFCAVRKSLCVTWIAEVKK